MLPIAVDAMGGDKAPGEIVEGARQAAAAGIPIILVGQPEVLGTDHGLEVIPASEVIGMADDAAKGVRNKKDSSLVRAAEAVRDGKASAMVSAGNTGATMASALLRMGRIKGVNRPAIATPIPVPGGSPTVMLDAGANAECSPEWLVQFAQMGAVLAAQRFSIKAPKVGLLSIGEEDTKGNSLVKETHKLLRTATLPEGAAFIGNVEGRDIMSDGVDVVVTDGFTGNVALKTMEGTMRALVGAIIGLLGEAGQLDDVLPTLLPLYAADVDPENTGGAVLLGVEGVCIISHGSSSAVAMLNACRVAADMVESDVVGKLRAAITA